MACAFSGEVFTDFKICIYLKCFILREQLDKLSDIMKKRPPYPAEDFVAEDIYGKSVSFGDYKNKALILCFFRDVARPNRNKRVFELTRNYKAWLKIGVEIVVVFSEKPEQVRSFFSQHPRPFKVIADPQLKLYKKYGVERMIGDSKSVVIKKSHRIIDRLFRGKRAKFNPIGRIMPAEFLINFDGVVVDTWHGRDELDHIPIDRLERFVMSMRVEMRKRVLSGIKPKA